MVQRFLSQWAQVSRYGASRSACLARVCRGSVSHELRLPRPPRAPDLAHSGRKRLLRPQAGRPLRVHRRRARDRRPGRLRHDPMRPVVGCNLAISLGAAARQIQAGQFARADGSSDWRALSSKFLRRFADPSPKCVPEVRRIAKSQGKGDVLHRHRRFAQVAQCGVSSEFVGQFAKRGVLQAKLAPERAWRRVEQFGYGGK